MQGFFGLALLLLLSCCYQVKGFTQPNIRQAKTKSCRQSTTNLFVESNAHDTDPAELSKDPLLERITNTRDYPLFLAEKAAEFLEATANDVSKSIGIPSSSISRRRRTQKEKVVVLGTGWGGASLLQKLRSDLYDITVISPRDYFLFTPMLAGASVGTVEFKSITEPIRDINPAARFIEAKAMSIEIGKKIVSCLSTEKGGDENRFDVNYDYLVVTVGAQTNTFGIPGVEENCLYLRQVEDARYIRSSIYDSFEKASLSSITEEEKKELLTFVVIGAGPTGIEFAAELRDFIEQDGPKYYPDLLKHVSIKVLGASSTILSLFDEELREEAVQAIKSGTRIQSKEVLDQLPPNFELSKLLLNSSVTEVTEEEVVLNDGSTIRYGLAVWAAGNGAVPLTMSLIETLGEAQGEHQDVARGRIAIDPWMRVLGTDGSILAFGDCTYVVGEALPATAQVASQQGEYLAKLMNNEYQISQERPSDDIKMLSPPTRNVDQQRPVLLSEAIADYATGTDSSFAKPFQFLNLGILAYTGGGTAISQISPLPDADNVQLAGPFANVIWRTVYLSKQLSWRSRFLVVNDWAKKSWYGRGPTPKSSK